MNVKTHVCADTRLLGIPVIIEDDMKAEVELKTIDEMTIDERGLVHGGFTFGLADYAAMLSVNHPNVVLGRSESRYTAPVRIGDVMRAKAVVKGREGKRRDVKVEVYVGERIVFEGHFTCYILDGHVLDR